MDLTPQAIDAIFYNFKTDYQSAYIKVPTWWQKVASLVPSVGRENRYTWLDKIPRLRKWVGERVYNNLSARGYTLVNDDYEDTFEVDRNTIADDQLGIFAQSPAMLADAAAHWPDDMITTIMQGGAAATALGFDNQPFFNANHPQNMDLAGSPVQSNLFSAATSGALPLTSQNYQTVRAAMGGYLASDGKALGVTPTLLVVPPQLETAGRQILNADFTAPANATGQNAANAQQRNVLQGSAELLVVPQLANEPTVWYPLDMSKPIKPFVFQKRQDPVFQQFTNPGDKNVFDRKKFVFGVDARGAAGYSLWFLAARCVG